MFRIILTDQAGQSKLDTLIVLPLVLGLVWQKTQKKIHFIFTFFNNNQHQNILTFFTFYITSIIFYYY
jgi:hypothetical protein